MTEILDAPVPGAVVTSPAEVTTADVLVRAADLLEEFGWCQGVEGMPDSNFHRGKFCVAGAVKQAQRDMLGYWPSRTYEDAEAVMGWDRDGSILGAAWMWNDAVSRTKAEVVAYLRTAATSAREGASK